MSDTTKTATKAHNWQPACGGTEVPFTARGRRLHYLFCPATGEHAYLDLGSDTFLTADEAAALLAS